MENEVNITGWDFTPLTKSGRMQESPLPWNYHAIVKECIPRVMRMLDMGTGGGEFLMSLLPLPKESFATEGYEPNVKIAEENLKPIGVKVISGYKDNALPFENSFFDLVINRHEYYHPAEVHRILKLGGYFITQQVKGNCDETILKFFGVKGDVEFKEWCLDKATGELKNYGFEILNKGEAIGFTKFSDLEALVSYIKVINWLVPDFSIEKYSETLNKVKLIIEEKGCFKSTLDRFFLVSKKIICKK